MPVLLTKHLFSIYVNKSNNDQTILASIILTCCLFNCHQCGTLPTEQLAEQTLINSLLNGYNKIIRPNYQVTVGISTVLQQIVAINEKSQTMTSSSFLAQVWADERLSWTPNVSNYNTEV